MKKDKNSVDTQFTLAKMWHLRGKFERAIAGYLKVINLRPDYIAAHLELGGLLRQQERIEEAITVYRRASELNPDETVFSNIIQRLLNEQAEDTSAEHVTSVPFQNQNTGRNHILLYTDCPDANGVGQCSHILLCELKSIGFKITCAQPKASHYLIDERNQLGIPHVWIEHDDIYNKTKTARAFTNFDEAEKLFTITKPDFVIFASGCPLSSLAAKQIAGRLNIPYLEIIHCVTDEWAEQFASHLHKLQQVYEKASSVIAVSHNNLNLLQKHFGLPEDKGQVIYNGRPHDFFKLLDPLIRQYIRQQLHIPMEAVVAFTSGRMEIVKGYQYLVEAIKNLQRSEAWQNLYFVWAGTGTIENNLRAVIERLDATNKVRFLGQRNDIPALLDAADMFILPSHFEGMPLSIMEAMAKGLPIIATSVSGIPEELGDTGKLLPNPEINRQATISELAKTIENWALDEKLRHSIGDLCKQRAEKMFRAKPMLKKYISLIETVIQPTSFTR